MCNIDDFEVMSYEDSPETCIENTTNPEDVHPLSPTITDKSSIYRPAPN